MGPLKTAKASGLGFGISFRSLLSCQCCPMARYARSLSRYLTYLVSYFTYAYTGLWSGFAWPSEGSDALKVPEKPLICWYVHYFFSRKNFRNMPRLLPRWRFTRAPWTSWNKLAPKWLKRTMPYPPSFRLVGIKMKWQMSLISVCCVWYISLAIKP